MSVTTEQLIAAAQEAADLTNVEDYVTNETWIAWLNDGARELHRKVCKRFKATYFRTWDFTIAEGASSFVLPSNFSSLLGLDIDPDTIHRRAVLPFNFAERNHYKATVLTMFGPETIFDHDRYYNVVGSSQLRLQPQERAAGTYRLYYVPKPKVLAAVRTITRDTPTDQVNSSAEGFAEWTFSNFLLSYPVALQPKQAIVNVGDILTLTSAGSNNGAREIVSVLSDTTAMTYGSYTAGTLGVGPVATLATCLDPELEPYSEYVWLTAAMKSLNKEESFAQIRMLSDQRALIDDDLTEVLETDQGGPATVIDVYGDE
jgi:hypothetical protein